MIIKFSGHSYFATEILGHQL